MSENQLLPDDARLTAYALGELDPTEQAEVERLLAEAPAAQVAVQEIRDVAGLLTTEMRQEPAPELTSAQRSAILAGKVAPVVPLRSMSRRAARWISRFAAMASMIALVALAAFLPAPGKRLHDPLSSEFFVNGEIRNSSRAGQLNFAMRENGEFEPDFDSDVDALARTSLSGMGVDATLAQAASVAASGVQQGKIESLSEGEQLLSDGSARFAGNLKLKKGLQPESRMNDPKAGNERADHDRFSGIGDRISVRVSESGRGRPGPKASGKEGFKRPIPPMAEMPAPQVSQTRPLKGDQYLYSEQSDDAPVGKTATGNGSGGAVLAAGKHSFQQSRMMGGGGGGGYKSADFGAKSGDKSNQRSDRPSESREGRAERFEKELNGLSGSAAGDVAELEYPEARKWQELQRRRAKYQREEASYALAFLQGLGTEAYDPITENPFCSSYEDPLSTFGIDVDTASYANVRRFLTQQQLPPPNAVRIEELVNYFSYDYPQPAGDQPFSVNIESGRCPWSPGHGLVRIGLKGREIDPARRPASNLVFLVDVSGSMQPENKLPLVKMGLNLLTQQMTESDRVAIVTYSDTAVQRLESTNGTDKPAILGVVDSLQAGGSTNGAGGIQLAYRTALDHFIAGGTNRVILCTDGDFNVGVTNDDELVQLIQERARTRVFFSVLGFGMGNLKDGKLEKLADKGNGHYAYIDSQREARKVFVEDLAGTLVTIAKDVKLQVEFNPNQVGAYRLIGYENRVMAAQDFNNDAKDAGDIGAGHTVTALYETLPAGEAPRPLVGDTLRYRKAVVPQEGGLAQELLTVKLRYKLPEGDTSTLVEVPVANKAVTETANAAGFGARTGMSPDFNWAAAVAAFGMILRDSQFRGQASFDMVLELAQGARGEDKAGRRQEFIDLVKSAQALYGGGSPATVVAPVEPQATPLTREAAEAKATVNGKYKNLLRIVEAPGDSTSYGSLHDYGRWEGTSYLDQNNLPQGYWVYVAPNWYIWGDETKRRE
jgi:Ca-activated chloride channel family protein